MYRVMKTSHSTVAATLPVSAKNGGAGMMHDSKRSCGPSPALVSKKNRTEVAREGAGLKVCGICDEGMFLADFHTEHLTLSKVRKVSLRSSTSSSVKSLIASASVTAILLCGPVGELCAQ